MKPVTNLSQAWALTGKRGAQLAFLGHNALPGRGLWELAIILDTPDDGPSEWHWQVRPERAPAGLGETGGHMDTYLTRFVVPEPVQALGWAPYGPLKGHPARLTHASVATWLQESLRGTTLIAPHVWNSAGHLVKYLNRADRAMTWTGMLDLNSYTLGWQNGSADAARIARWTFDRDARDNGFGPVEPLDHHADAIEQARWARRLWAVLNGLEG